MRVALTASGETLESTIDPRFGRCQSFLVVETDDMSVQAVHNLHAQLGRGAGIQAASLMAELGVAGVLTGSCGPNAHEALSAAEIPVYLGCSGRCDQVLERFRRGELEASSAPNSQGHRRRS